jgi:GT2 family glycosyltransferase
MTRSATIGLYVICHERPEEMRDAIASAAGFDEVFVLDMASSPPLAPMDGIEMLRSDDNLWVTGGRNLLASHATADVLVFLDDDAVFLTPRPADAIRDALEEHGADAIAFRIVRPTGETVSSEIPFPGNPEITSPRICGYFLGGAVAIRRGAFERAGGYDPQYEYSTEEIDLAFSLQRNGSSLVYDPRIVIEHRASPHGRAPSPHVPALRFRNRLWLVRAHLPIPIAVVHGLVWCGRTLREAIATRDVRPWLRAWRPGLRRPIDRRPLSYKLLFRIQGNGGRVWW